MEENCGGGQGLTKGCGAKGRRRWNSESEVTIGQQTSEVSKPWSAF
jgi:hypothetical protein